jgi:DNA-binding MarR family transcriptional regulator
MRSLDVLFAEVTALAHQLRKTDFRAQQGDGEGLLAAGRSVLEILDQQGPQTVPAIAARQNSSRQNIQIIANRFAAEGLVEFLTNPAHKKSDLARITVAGRRTLEASAIRQKNAREVVAISLPESQIITATEILNQVRHDLAPANGTAHPDPARKRKPRLAEPPSESENTFPGNNEEESLPYNLL